MRRRCIFSCRTYKLLPTNIFKPTIAFNLYLIGDLFFQDESHSVELVVKRDIDPKAMKINELRDELDGRGLSSKGIFFFLLLTLALPTRESELKSTALTALLVLTAREP